MGSFLRMQRHPIEPVLEVYELDHREPRLKIDSMGEVWLSPAPSAEFDPTQVVDSIIPPERLPRLPKILFADVPVMIHTSYGFSLAPLSEANDRTGPER